MNVMGFLKTVPFRLDERLASLREQAKGRRDPATEDETLALLLAVARMRAPRRILEIGTAEGLSSTALLLECKDARLTTVETEESLWRSARENFTAFGVADRVNALLSDAGDVLAALEDRFDLIFLDGPKAQYIHYLPDLKRLLAPRGVLFADDVLLYGWVSGREPVPPKRRSIVERLREYLRAVREDPDFLTSIIEVGEGVAISVLRDRNEEPCDIPKR